MTTRDDPNLAGDSDGRTRVMHYCIQKQVTTLRTSEVDGLVKKLLAKSSMCLKTHNLPKMIHKQVVCASNMVQFGTEKHRSGQKNNAKLFGLTHEKPYKIYYNSGSHLLF